MVWIQTVCKGYQQRTKVAASKERVKGNLKFATDGIFKFCGYIKANIKDSVLKCNNSVYYMPSTFYIVKLPLALGNIFHWTESILAQS